MSTSPTAGQKRARPSMASYLRDSDDPILIATNFPKKARPATPPASMRTIPTSLRSSSTSTSSLSAFPALDADLTTSRPLVGTGQSQWRRDPFSAPPGQIVPLDYLRAHFNSLALTHRPTASKKQLYACSCVPTSIALGSPLISTSFHTFSHLFTFRSFLALRGSAWTGSCTALARQYGDSTRRRSCSF